MNARIKRSSERPVALQYLVESVLDRSGSDVRTAAIIDEDARIVAGAGARGDFAGLARVAGPVARGEACAELDAVTQGTDLLTRAVVAGGRTYYLAAIGSRVRKMTDAARGLARIVETL